MDINQALLSLDHTDQSLWTSNGLPLVDVVSKLVGKEVTRQEITNADPSFVRKIPEQVASTANEQTTTDEDDTPPSDDGDTPPSDDGDTPPPNEDEEIQISEKQAAFILSNTREALTEDLEDIDTEIADLKTVLDGVKKNYDDAVTRRDAIVNKIDAIKAALPPENPYLDYIKSQNEQRAAKVRARTVILGNMDPSFLETRSPLDAAFARRTSRGTARPTR